MQAPSLRHMIGQMLLAGFPGTEMPDAQAMRLMEEYLVGNFILFARNIGPAGETARLCGALSFMKRPALRRSSLWIRRAARCCARMKARLRSPARWRFPPPSMPPRAEKPQLSARSGGTLALRCARLA